MSATLLFAIGSIVFAITVYGTVMAGGMALTRRHVRQHDEFRHRVDDDDLDAPIPTDIRY